MADKEANYEKPTVLLDLEARQEAGWQPATVKKVGQDAEVSKDGFIGVDQIYRNFANETEAPMTGDEGAEAKVEEAYYSDDVDFKVGAAGEEVKPEDRYAALEEEEESEGGDPNKPPATPKSASTTEKSDETKEQEKKQTEQKETEAEPAPVAPPPPVARKSKS